MDELDKLAGGDNRSFRAQTFKQLVSEWFVKKLSSETCEAGMCYIDYVCLFVIILYVKFILLRYYSEDSNNLCGDSSRLLIFLQACVYLHGIVLFSGTGIVVS